MEKNELMKVLTDVAAARENLDQDSKAVLIKSQLTVLRRKLEESKKEKDKVFQSVADTILAAVNQLEVYTKIENHLTSEIENMETELRSIGKETKE